MKMPNITRRQFIGVSLVVGATALGSAATAVTFFPRKEVVKEIVYKSDVNSQLQKPTVPYSPQPKVPQNQGRVIYGEGTPRGLGEVSNDLQRISGHKADFFIVPNKRSPQYAAYDKRNPGNGYELNYRGSSRGVDKIVNGRREVLLQLLDYMLQIDPVRDGDELRILNYVTKAVIDFAVKR